MRMPVTDRALTGLVSWADLHDVVIPAPDELAAAFARLAALGPEARLGLTFADDTSWHYLGAGIAERRHEIFREPGDGDPRRWLEEYRIADLPVQFAVSPERLVVRLDHRLADGLMVAVLLPTLITMVRDGQVPKLFSDLVPHPLAAAVRHSLMSPSQLRAVLADRREFPAPAHDHGHGRDSGGERISQCLWLDSAALSRIRSWAHGRISFGPALTLLAAAALRSVGIPVAEDANLVVDLRRYLPPKAKTFRNMVAGFAVPTRARPEAVQERVTRALAVGRPLAGTALGVIKSQGRGILPDGHHAGTGVAQVSMSSVGILRGYDKLPWLVEPGSRRAESAVNALEPDAVSFVVHASDSRLQVSVNHRTDLFSTEAVAAAMAAMGEPDQLLQAPRP